MQMPGKVFAPGADLGQFLVPGRVLGKLITHVENLERQISRPAASSRYGLTTFLAWVHRSLTFRGFRFDFLPSRGGPSAGLACPFPAPDGSKPSDGANLHAGDGACRVGWGAEPPARSPSSRGPRGANASPFDGARGVLLTDGQMRGSSWQVRPHDHRTQASRRKGRRLPNGPEHRADQRPRPLPNSGLVVVADHTPGRDGLSSWVRLRTGTWKRPRLSAEGHRPGRALRYGLQQDAAPWRLRKAKRPGIAGLLRSLPRGVTSDRS